MIIHKTKFPSVLSYFFVICLISSITIFTTYTWGRYVLMGCLAAILACDILRSGGKYRMFFGAYLALMLLFLAYTTVSSLWAMKASLVLEKSQTLLEILLMIFVLYNHYKIYPDSVKQALRDVKISSFVIVIYTLIFYGIPQLMLMAASEERLENEFANINTIGIFAAMGVIIQIDEMVRRRKFSFLSLFCIPSLLMIALTQSRKALVMVVMGVALILWARRIYSGSLFKTLYRLILYAAVATLIIGMVLSLPVFDGVIERMISWFNSFTGKGEVDSSTLARNEMMQIGLQTFFEHPLFGIGIGNSNELVKLHMKNDAYLHNNFVELLACGGIVGFGIYYAMYVYLITRFIKYRKHKTDEYVICVILMLVLLAMDYGRVSYYTKTQYIFLMVMFLETDVLRKIAGPLARRRRRT